MVFKMYVSYRYFRCIKMKTMMMFIVMFVCLMLFIELMKYHKFLIHGNILFFTTDEDKGMYLFSDAVAVIENHLPGSFLKSNTPTNDSYCNFNYGLPGERFQWHPHELQHSPQSISYNVLYNVINGTSQTLENIPPVTYATHATIEYIFYVSEIARYWDGPVSIALFVPGSDTQLAIEYLTKLCSCLPEMGKVSVHFLFPYKYPPQTLTNYVRDATTTQFPSVPDCHVPDLSNIMTFRNKKSLSYPVNVARNVARIGAQTKFLMVSDVELIPSKNLAGKFMDMLDRINRKPDAFSDGGKMQKLIRHVFVVPVFEIEYVENIPRTKKLLQHLYEEGKAVYFHRWVCLHCQRFPGLQRWISKSIPEDIIKPLVVVRREFPYHRWEPIYIGTNNDPLYSETLSWEGLQDKMLQMLEMCLLKYRFVILDGAFLIHTPGIKRPTNRINDAWRRPYQRHNTKQYTAILKYLASQYERNPRCRLQ